ncbi:BOLA class I histocompatibility antigen, alpha chain BL3-7-like isoform X4 [Pangasianodon hypophthalmus]|uniref:BOLA class I histocompatibility antigen, alpha chain BL3-7-like isoform X4 n=1 Tax=Pangasianodon hypophthalmus TaxID=310915 RepID=UPI000EFFDFEC|nr:BOLA class I histocompatibility antigen, alpha chain BL3-7-like isoform X4 [Pangasianodon hypophthalmus]
MKSLLLFTACFLHVSADTQSLQYYYTALTQGIHFPEFTAVGLLNGEQFMFYSSSNRLLIPKDWIKKPEDETYWKSETQDMQGHQDSFISKFTTVLNQFNHSKGAHILQRMFGCECDDDGTTRGYDQYGYDGEDFINLNLKNATWTQAVIFINKWDPRGAEAKYWKSYLENDCIDWLKKYVSNGRETLERKVRPEASAFQKHSPSPEVVCHATGFFPKAVVISWQEDGEEVHENVALRETLPNQDGSFQKRSILTVPAEELQKHNYTCVIQHSSLEKELVLPVRGGASIAIIVAVVVALVAVVAGIVVWKKKNSGFRPVPAKAPLKEILPPTTLKV